MAKNSIYDYSTSPSSNSDIGGIGILGTNAVLNFDDAFRTLMAQIATDISPRRLSIQGEIYGLTLSNNATDATNDIDIAVGVTTTDSTTDPRTMVLATALTKRLDAAWAVGTGNGGLDTGAIADTWYHVWLIQRSDTGVVDALFSASATSPTMPANYDRKRRIGAIRRASSTITPFWQNGDKFVYFGAIQNRNSTAAVTNGLVTVSTPSGVQTSPILQLSVSTNATTTMSASVGLGPSSAATFLVQQAASSALMTNVMDGWVETDTSSQIRFTLAIGSGSLAAHTVSTIGWYDRRGA